MGKRESERCSDVFLKGEGREGGREGGKEEGKGKCLTDPPKEGAGRAGGERADERWASEGRAERKNLRLASSDYLCEGRIRWIEDRGSEGGRGRALLAWQ